MSRLKLSSIWLPSQYSTPRSISRKTVHTLEIEDKTARVIHVAKAAGINVEDRWGMDNDWDRYNLENFSVEEQSKLNAYVNECLQKLYKELNSLAHSLDGASLILHCENLHENDFLTVHYSAILMHIATHVPNVRMVKGSSTALINLYENDKLESSFLESVYICGSFNLAAFRKRSLGQDFETGKVDCIWYCSSWKCYQSCCCMWGDTVWI